MAKRTSKQADNDFQWQQKNGWLGLPPAETKQIEAYCRDYLGFLSAAKTERETHDLALALAREHGFKELSTTGRACKPGDCVMRSYHGKTLFLARIGRRPFADGLHIVGAHTDAPRLDGKPNPLYEDSELALLDTHYYGGIKKYQWVTLPLALHGVIVKQDGTVVPVSIGEKPDDPVFVITDLLPHLGKDQAKKVMDEGIPGENLNVLFGSIPVPDEKAKEAVKQNILRLLNAELGIREEDFASAELEIVPAGPGRELGLDRSMMLGYGHDDRVCAYAGLRSLLDCEEIPEYTAVVVLCDKEEIGSVGATGMESTFFENSVAELLACTTKRYSELDLRHCLERSRMISADVSALHDPNFPEVSSPNNNMARMNHGIVVHKYGGARGKSHSSDASAEFMAVIRRVFNEADVLWQTGELGKVDQGGGGTIAMFLARYGMDVVDAGVGLFSMHAPWEVAGKLDTYMAYKAYRAFLTHTR